MPQVFSASPCPLCNGRRAHLLPDEMRVLRIMPPRQLVKCLYCGLGYVDPLPDVKTAAPYDENYFQQYAEQGVAFAGGDGIVSVYLRKRLALLESWVEKKGCLLDVGCGKGYFVEYAQAKGWKAIGLDVSRFAVDLCRSRGLDVRLGTLEKIELPVESFDVVHMNHVLEHMVDPFSSLKRAHGLLKSKGILAIEVPNEFDDWFERVRPWIVRKPRDPYVVPSSHTVFFNAQTLTRSLILAGFSQPKVVSVTRPESLQSKWWFGEHFKRVGYWLADRFKRGQLIVALAPKR